MIGRPVRPVDPFVSLSPSLLAYIRRFVNEESFSGTRANKRFLQVKSKHVLYTHVLYTRSLHSEPTLSCDDTIEEERMGVGKVFDLQFTTNGCGWSNGKFEIGVCPCHGNIGLINKGTTGPIPVGDGRSISFFETALCTKPDLFIHA